VVCTGRRPSQSACLSKVAWPWQRTDLPRIGPGDDRLSGHQGGAAASGPPGCGRSSCASCSTRTVIAARTGRCRVRGYQAAPCANPCAHRARRRKNSGSPVGVHQGKPLLRGGGSGKGMILQDHVRGHQLGDAGDGHLPGRARAVRHTDAADVSGRDPVGRPRDRAQLLLAWSGCPGPRRDRPGGRRRLGVGCHRPGGRCLQLPHRATSQAGECGQQRQDSPVPPVTGSCLGRLTHAASQGSVVLSARMRFSVCRRYTPARSIESMRVLVVEDEPYRPSATGCAWKRSRPTSPVTATRRWSC
jgi:hypothetical protein